MVCDSFRFLNELMIAINKFVTLSVGYLRLPATPTDCYGLTCLRFSAAQKQAAMA
jgi:hypothetical protein